MKYRKTLLILLTSIVMFIVSPMISKGLNIANVADDNSTLSYKNGYYYINWEGKGKKIFKNKYIEYNLGGNYKLKVTFKSAETEETTFSSEGDLNESCKVNLGTEYDSKNFPCKSIAGKPKGRLIAIKENQISIHMWGIKRLNLKYEVMYNGKTMNQSEVKSQLGKINVNLIDIDNQQAIIIPDDSDELYYDKNIIKGQKFANDKTKNCYYCKLEKAKNNRLQSKEGNVDKQRGYIKFSTTKGTINLSFFSGQKGWLTTSGYKYGHAFFEFKGDTGDSYDVKTKLTIKKTDENGNNLKGSKFEIYNKKNQKVKEVNMINSYSETINLAPGEYIIKETVAPQGYDIGNPITVILGSNQTKVITIKNKKSELNECENILKNEYGLTVEKNIGDITYFDTRGISGETKLKLINLYNDYYKKGINYNGLLMFNTEKVSCEMLTMKNKLNSGCNKTENEVGLYFKLNPKTLTNNNDIWIKGVDKSASYGAESLWETQSETGGTTYCHITNFSITSKNIKSGVKVNKGVTIWKNNENKMADGVIDIVCDNYNKNVVDNNNWSIIDGYLNGLKNVVDDGKIKLVIESETNEISEMEAVSSEASILLNSYETGNFLSTKKFTLKFNINYPNALWYNIVDGNAYFEKEVNSIFGGYGLITSPTIVDNDNSYEFRLKISDIDDFKDYFNYSEETASCVYSTTQGIPPDTSINEKSKRLNLEFRIIDTSSWAKAFPGINGTGENARNTGSNWTKNEDNEKVIIENNNSYNRNGKTPLVSLTLNSSGIKKIKNYNKENSSYNVDITCIDGKECKSSFVSSILNNEYGTYSGSCKNGNNRNYCVGGA